jgi:hypothetical protein
MVLDRQQPEARQGRWMMEVERALFAHMPHDAARGSKPDEGSRASMPSRVSGAQVASALQSELEPTPARSSQYAGNTGRFMSRADTGPRTGMPEPRANVHDEKDADEQAADLSQANARPAPFAPHSMPPAPDPVDAAGLERAKSTVLASPPLVPAQAAADAAHPASTDFVKAGSTGRFAAVTVARNRLVQGGGTDGLYGSNRPLSVPFAGTPAPGLPLVESAAEPAMHQLVRTAQAAPFPGGPAGEAGLAGTSQPDAEEGVSVGGNPSVGQGFERTMFHLTEGEAGLHAWIRDATLSPGQQQAMAAALMGQATGFAAPLAAVSINGRLVASADREKPDWRSEFEDGMSAGEPGNTAPADNKIVKGVA